MGLIIGALAIAFSFFPSQSFARKKPKNGWEFRLRASPLYGAVRYQGTSTLTNAKSDYTEARFGGNLELEYWLTPYFGAITEATGWQLGAFKRSAYTGFFNFLPATRIFGESGAMSSETVFFVGPQMSYIPDLRGYYQKEYYDLIYLRLFGITGGMHWKFALNKQYALDIFGAYTFQIRPYGTDGLKFYPKESRNIVGRGILDYRIDDGIGIGFGFQYESYRVVYKPNGLRATQAPHSVDILTTAGILSLRLWL